MKRRTIAGPPVAAGRKRVRRPRVGVSGTSAAPSIRRAALAAGAASGLAGAVGALWTVEHRAVVRGVRAASEADRRAAGLVMPDDIVHRWVELDDGGVAHAVERGDGPPIVLLHGITLAADVWSRQLADLGDRYRVVAVDFRGHGRSTVGADGFTGGIGCLAGDVRQVLHALDLTGALLVGHSMGGMVALELVADAPPEWTAARIGALALVATSAGPVVDMIGARTALMLSRTLSGGLRAADRIGLSTAPSADIRWWAARANFGPEADPVQVAIAEELGAGTPLRTLAGLIGPVAAFDVSQRLGHVDLPALVVVGSHDRLTPPRHAQRLQAALPDARLVELPRAGHMLMLERPHELSRLLAEHAGAAAGPAPLGAGGRPRVR